MTQEFTFAMGESLSKQDVASMLQNWLAGNITTDNLAVWAHECADKWEDGELKLEDTELLYEVLYELKLTSEAESGLSPRTLSEKDAQRLIRRLDNTANPISFTRASTEFMGVVNKIVGRLSNI